MIFDPSHWKVIFFMLHAVLLYFGCYVKLLSRRTDVTFLLRLPLKIPEQPLLPPSSHAPLPHTLSHLLL